MASSPRHIPDDKLLSLRVKYGEIEIGNAVRAAGGAWYPHQKVWILPYKEIVALGLPDRIVLDPQEEAFKDS